MGPRLRGDDGRGLAYDRGRPEKACSRIQKFKEAHLTDFLPKRTHRAENHPWLKDIAPESPPKWRGPGGRPTGPLQDISQPVSRVLYGAGSDVPARDGHSSGTPVARRLKQPTRTAGSGHRSRSRLRGRAPSLFGLAPGGVCHAADVAADAVRSYRTFSPLPRQIRNAPRRFVLCGTVPEACARLRGTRSAGRYPAPYVHGARTFLPGDLSVPAGAAVRPTDAIRDGGARPPRQEFGR
jgi:hypothetical protein